MITVKLNSEGRVVGFATDADFNTPELWQQGLLENRNDWPAFERAEEIAAQLTQLTGKKYIATDAGGSCYPRYDVMEAWTVGEEVSYAFNGDSYPCGIITKITPSGMVVTSDGKKFRRKGSTGSWKNGTWSLVAGHEHKWNPSF